MDILSQNNGVLGATAIQLPTVSVIVVNCGYAPYCRQAVESILCQTYPNVECIVMDDAAASESSMAPADIKAQYPNVNVIRHAIHQGRAPAAADGLAVCRGAYVILLDANDILLPHCIEMHVFVHLSLRIHVGFTSGDMLQVANNEVVVSTGKEFNRHIQRRKKINRNFYRPYDHPCGANWSTKHLGPSLAEKIYFVPPLSGKRVSAPDSGNCYRRDALLLFSDNPALAGLRAGTGTYFARGIGALCGSVLIDEPVFAHRVEGHTMPPRCVELNRIFDSETARGNNDSKTRLLLIDHLVANAARFAPNYWLGLNLIALIGRLDCRDSNPDLPRWAQRSRLAQQLVAHYETIAPVLGPTAVKLLMLCARVPLRIILRMKESKQSQPIKIVPPSPLTARTANPNLPLHGKTILLVHPAWHSCGSYQVFACQARAYHSLGAKVISLAIADSPFSGGGARASETYLAATGDLEADLRIFARTPLRKIWLIGFLRVGWQWLAGNYAATRLAVVRRAIIPDVIAAVSQIDLIHCNHFFCMPIAARLRGQYKCPVLLDTHDLQARQYALGERAFWLMRRPSYEKMLALELNAMRSAELLVHLNAEEAAAFEELLPGKRQVLLYPAADAMPAGEGVGDAIIVASANYPNFLGLRWFLQEVLPLAPNVPVQIIGNIDRLFRRHAPYLLKECASLFRGRVEIAKLRDAYQNASAVLLPATAGHGISIKTIEALSCGAPLIATPLAFRGFPAGAADLPNVTVTEDAASFAAALRRAYELRHVPDLARVSSPTRQFYQRHFAFNVYSEALGEIVGKLLEKETGTIQA